jgi:hypothetical protein
MDTLDSTIFPIWALASIWRCASAASANGKTLSDFWKALAGGRKWEDVNAWRFQWHRFIDHLADGKDADSFFAAL